MSHLATVPPTQIAHPWLATVRTILQTIAGVVIGFASVIAVAAVLAPQFLDAIAILLPPEWYAYALAVVAFIGTLAGAVARIMAIPGVNNWLTRAHLGAAPGLTFPLGGAPLDGE